MPANFTASTYDIDTIKSQKEVAFNILKNKAVTEARLRQQARTSSVMLTWGSTLPLRRSLKPQAFHKAFIIRDGASIDRSF